MRAIVVFAAAAAGLLLLEPGPEEGRWERAGAAEHGHGRLGAAAEHRRGGWERTAAPANGLSGLEAVPVGGRVVVVGGADYDQTRVKALVFDLESGRWSRAARSPLPWRAGHSVVAANGRVIVWGGFGRIEGLRRGGGRRGPARRA